MPSWHQKELFTFKSIIIMVNFKERQEVIIAHQAWLAKQVQTA